nr:hypothetical protein [Candidatus Woesearchaeota archaeon]
MVIRKYLWSSSNVSSKKIFPVLLFLFLLANKASAHCPLCTVGIAAAAGGAAWLGVSQIIIGLFTGALAVSMGYWISRMIKKTYIPFQKTIIILLSFITTIVPLLNVMEGFYPAYISIVGSYGSLLNRTYLINAFLTGSLIGAIIVSISPYLSNFITRLRKNKTLPFQTTALTLSLLIMTSIIIEAIT